MIKVVGVRFKKAGKIYYFDPADMNIQKDTYVVVETARGIEFGDCVIGIKEINENDIVAPLKSVLRIATEEDIDRHFKNKDKEKDAFNICLKKIQEHGLTMKLIDVEYTFDNNKVIFYFTADAKSPKKLEQHIGLPQGPRPPNILASSLTPICLSSIRVLNIVAKSLTNSLKSTLPSAVK